MRLGVPVSLVVLLAAVLVAACTRGTDGRAVVNPAQAGRPLIGNDVDSLLLSPKQLSDIVGAPVQVQLDQTRPVGGGPSGPCAALATPAADAFVGDSFSALHILALTDGNGDEHAHVVTQAAAVYPDAATAARAFGTATGGLGNCDGRRVNDEAYWKFAVNEVTPDTVGWNKVETDIPQLWVCYGQGRVRNNAIVEAMVCQGTDAAAQNADTVANRMAAAVWELSAR